MRIKRFISALLAVITLAAACAFAPAEVSAAQSYSGLDRTQTYFTRTIGSLARADYYQTDVLASVTLSQAVYESGWARYTLPVKGNNLFGIKAYNNWTGMVFDPNNDMVYPSYYDMMLVRGQSYMNSATAWQAYRSWQESVRAHSWLFETGTAYAPVIGEKDYKAAIRAIVRGGYCSDNGYAETVISLIEKYGYTEYDDLEPDEDGVVAITADVVQKWLSPEDTFTVGLITYPEEAVPSSVVWTSDDESVATVDEEGNVTAVSFGQTLISAALPNGREACCIVYVDCNATVINASVNLRAQPSVNASNLGSVNIGTPIKLLSGEIFNDGMGNDYYYALCVTSRGAQLSGYVSADYVYRHKYGVETVDVVRDSITLLPGDEYPVYTVVAPSHIDDTTLTWTSSDDTVATVDENGVVTAVANGVTTVTATAASGVSRPITVTVAGSYRESYALVSSYDTITVRSEPDSASPAVGRIPFCNMVRVIGESIGYYYKCTGLDTNGRSITGYINCSYLRFVDPKAEILKVTAGEGIKVYAEKSEISYCFGSLISGSTVTVLNTDDEGWSYVIGVKNPGSVNSITGYAKLDSGSPGSDDPPVVEDSYYGVTTSELFVRTGPGQNNTAVGRFPINARIIITGEAENGWYRVTGTGTDGNPVSGYSSASYIKVLYLGSVNTDQLNLREGPDTTYDSLARLDKGTVLILVGEAENGWYRVESASPDDPFTGYCSARYINVVGRYSVDTPVFTGGFGLTDASLKIEQGVLLGVKPDTSVGELLSVFGEGVAVLSASGEALTDDLLVGTGCVVTEPGGDRVTVIIKGDVSGNGVIDMTDYLMIKRCFIGTYQLSGVYLSAALVSGRGSLSIVDYVMIKRVVIGTYSF